MWILSIGIHALCIFLYLIFEVYQNVKTGDTTSKKSKPDAEKSQTIGKASSQIMKRKKQKLIENVKQIEKLREDLQRELKKLQQPQAEPQKVTASKGKKNQPKDTGPTEKLLEMQIQAELAQEKALSDSNFQLRGSLKSKLGKMVKELEPAPQLQKELKEMEKQADELMKKPEKASMAKKAKPLDAMEKKLKDKFNDLKKREEQVQKMVAKQSMDIISKLKEKEHQQKTEKALEKLQEQSKKYKQEKRPEKKKELAKQVAKSSKEVVKHMKEVAKRQKEKVDYIKKTYLKPSKQKNTEQKQKKKKSDAQKIARQKQMESLEQLAKQGLLKTPVFDQMRKVLETQNKAIQTRELITKSYKKSPVITDHTRELIADFHRAQQQAALQQKNLRKKLKKFIEKNQPGQSQKTAKTAKSESKNDSKRKSKEESRKGSKQPSKSDSRKRPEQVSKNESKADPKNQSMQDTKKASKTVAKNESRKDAKKLLKQDPQEKSDKDFKKNPKRNEKKENQSERKEKLAQKTTKSKRLEKMRPDELHKKSLETEKEIRETWRKISAHHKAKILDIPVEKAYQETAVKKSEGKKIDKEVFKKVAKRMETWRKQRRALTDIEKDQRRIAKQTRDLLKKAREQRRSIKYGVPMKDYPLTTSAIPDVLKYQMKSQVPEYENLVKWLKSTTRKDWLPISPFPLEDDEKGKFLGVRVSDGKNAKGPTITKHTKHVIPGRRISKKGRPASWMMIDSWYRIGPFPNDKRDNLLKRFPPEFEIDLNASYPGKGGKMVRWKYHKNQGAMVTPEIIEEYVVNYFYTELMLEEGMDLWVAIGSDDHSKAWLNEKLIWNSPYVLKPWTIGEGYRKVYFKKGRNKILFRLENGYGPTAFSFILHTQAPKS